MFKSIGGVLLCSTLLTGCSTPQTVLRDNSGMTIVCGGSSSGSIAGGVIGYHIQKGMDEDCVNQHKASGFKIIQQEN